MAPDPLALRHQLAQERLFTDPERGWKRVKVPARWIDAHVDDHEWLSQWRQVFGGGESLTVMDTCTRYVASSSWPAASGEIARLYLRKLLGKRPTMRHRRSTARMLLNRSVPLFCQPHRGNLAYIDLRHAYWDIVQHYPFHTCYHMTKKRIISIGDPWPDPYAIDRDRRLRHALVGTLFTRQMQSYRYGTLTVDKVPGPYCQPALYRICMDTMAAIALDVSRHFELWGWLTDACVVNERDAQDVRQFLFERWDFTSRIDALGHGAIYSTTSYKIGDQRADFSRWSEDQKNSRRPKPHPYRYLPRVNVTWWRNERKRAIDASFES